MKRAVIAGASGFIGQYFVRKLRAEGWNVKTIGRSGDARWGDTSSIVRLLDGADLLLNLAGKSVSCRYTPSNRREIVRSRVETTKELGMAIGQCEVAPKDWFNASTGTIYRDARDRAQNEVDGELGSGFSVEVAKAWEQSLMDSPTAGTRKIALRITIVLGLHGGALPPMLNLARFGLGGAMAGGGQKFSWIHIDDLFKAVLFLHENRQIEGPVNVGAPAVVSNGLLMRKIRDALGVKVGLPTPRWLLQMGAVLIATEPELVLKSRWIEPETLSRAGFVWQFPNLEMALADILRRR